jgi:hypothetical protein
MPESKHCPLIDVECMREGCVFWIRTSGDNMPERFNCCVPCIAQALHSIEYQMISRRP